MAIGPDGLQPAFDAALLTLDLCGGLALTKAWPTAHGSR